MECVPAAASYTLGLCITHRNVVYNDEKEKTHMQLTICFPSKQFARRMEEKLRNFEHVEQNTVFKGQAVTRDKCEVSIILPSSVEKIEADTKGITLVFDKDKAEDATTWQQYAGIWLLKESQRFRIQYTWAHRKLAEAVAGPAE